MRFLFANTGCRNIRGATSSGAASIRDVARANDFAMSRRSFAADVSTSQRNSSRPRRKPKLVRFLTHDEARNYLKDNGIVLRNAVDFKKWSASASRPNNFPAGPHLTYRSAGWVSYPHFLGYGDEYEARRTKNRSAPKNILRGQLAEFVRYQNADAAYSFFVDEILPKVQLSEGLSFETYRLPHRSHATLLLRLRETARNQKVAPENDDIDHEDDVNQWIPVQLRAAVKQPPRERTCYKFEYIASYPGVNVVLCKPEHRVIAFSHCEDVEISAPSRRVARFATMPDFSVAVAARTLLEWWTSRPKRSAEEWVPLLIASDHDKVHHRAIQSIAKELYVPLGLQVRYGSRDGVATLAGRRCIHRSAVFFRSDPYRYCLNYESYKRRNLRRRLRSLDSKGIDSLLAGAVGTGGRLAAVEGRGEDPELYIAILLDDSPTLKSVRAPAEREGTRTSHEKPSLPESHVGALHEDSEGDKVQEDAMVPRERPGADLSGFQSCLPKIRGAFVFPRKFLTDRCPAERPRGRKMKVPSVADIIRHPELASAKERVVKWCTGELPQGEPLQKPEAKENTCAREAGINELLGETEDASNTEYIAQKLLVYPPFVEPHLRLTKEKQKRQLKYWIDFKTMTKSQQLDRFQNILSELEETNTSRASLSLWPVVALRRSME